MTRLTVYWYLNTIYISKFQGVYKYRFQIPAMVFRQYLNTRVFKHLTTLFICVSLFNSTVTQTSLNYTTILYKYYSNLYNAECQANQKRRGRVTASLRVLYSGEKFILLARPKTTKSVRRSCGCPETVPNLRCMVVERPRSEDGEHKWSVKQRSGSRSKRSGKLVVWKLFVKIQWGLPVLRLESKGR